MVGHTQDNPTDQKDGIPPGKETRVSLLPFHFIASVAH